MRNTMFTDTLPNALNTLTPLSNAATNLSVPSNPETTFDKFQQFRDIVPELINTNSPDIFYRAHVNEDDSANGEGLHEKFIYQGQSVVDISMGQLDYPWHAADANPACEIGLFELQSLAVLETNPVIAHRLQTLVTLSQTLLPTPFTRYYHYQNSYGVRAITIVDVINSVKLNVVITHTENQTYWYR